MRRRSTDLTRRASFAGTNAVASSTTATEKVRQRENARYDLYDIAHRTFELTSLDLLLREQERLGRRASALNSLNQSVSATSAFMKLFNRVSGKINERKSLYARQKCANKQTLVLWRKT